MAISLNIKVIPFDDDADLIINGKHYVFETARMADLGDLRRLIHDQPDYIYEALVGMMKEAANNT